MAIILGTIGNDDILGTANSDTITSLTGDDTIDAAGGNDIVDASFGNDNIIGGSGADLLTGGDGNDTIYAGTVSSSADNDGDEIVAGIGDDIIYAGSGDDISGGLGYDRLFLDLGNASSGVNVDFRPMTVGIVEIILGVVNIVTFPIQLFGAQIIGIESVEGVTATEFDDMIILDNSGNTDIGIDGGGGDDNLQTGAGNDALDGGTGADTLAGGAGNDSYFVDQSDDVVVEGIDAGNDSVTATADYTLSDNVENLTLAGAALVGAGNAGNNVIIGNGNDNILSGLEGDDTITGLGGSDELFGGDGDDSLDGGEGNDMLVGGVGADDMAGGNGDDIYSVDDAGDSVIENEDAGNDRVVSEIDYILGDNVEELRLSGAALNGTGNGLDNLMLGNDEDNMLNGLVGDDMLYGFAGDDVLDGGAGNDIFVGGDGNDLYYVDTEGERIVERLDEGNDSVIASVNYRLSSNVEDLALVGSALVGRGNALNNGLVGNAGDNRFQGFNGDDTISGGDGRDRLDGNEGDDSLNGGNDADRLYGGNGLDTLSGGDGNDMLFGGAGDDALLGGNGDDTYYVDEAGDTVTEEFNEGNDLVISSINFTLGENVEQLLLRGTETEGSGNALNNVITGSSGRNVLNGADGNDVIRGMNGRDNISGGEGNDTIDGGLGFDTMTGGAGNDRFVFSVLAHGDPRPQFTDIITDFDQSANERIQVNLLDADANTAGAQAFEWIGTGAFSGTAGEMRYEQIGGNTRIDADVNGDGVSDFAVQLTGLYTLDSTDFIGVNDIFP